MCCTCRIYSTPTASLLEGLTVTQGGGRPLFASVQRQNTLYAKMSLNDDDRLLAIGCNSGDILLWDVAQDGFRTNAGVQLSGGHRSE